MFKSKINFLNFTLNFVYNNKKYSSRRKILFKCMIFSKKEIK